MQLHDEVFVISCCILFKPGQIVQFSYNQSGVQVEHVKQRCLPNALNYPMLEEYDFRNDTVRVLVSVNLS